MLRPFLIGSQLLLLLNIPPVLAAPPAIEQLQDQLEAAQIAQDVATQETLLKQWLQRDPNNLIAYQELAHLFQQQLRSQEAIALYQAALKRHPNEISLYESLAVTLWNFDQRSQAIKTEAQKRSQRCKPH